MAYDVTAFTDFVARETKALTATLFAGGDTAKFARYMTGIKGKTSIPKIGGAATLQKGTCKSESGDTTVGEYFIEVTPWTFYEGFCEDDLQSKFPNTVLAPGSNMTGSPKTWQEQIVELKVASMQETLELTNWVGTSDAGSYPLYDGFNKLIDAATGVIDGNTGAVTAVTVSNIIAVVDAIYVAIPAKVKRTKEAVIAIGDDWFDLYVAALKAANLYHYSAEQDAEGVIMIGGGRGKLIRTYGLNETSRIFASKGSNFIVGSDTEDEDKVVHIWYSEDDDKVFMRTKAKSGVQIVNPTEIVEFTLAA